MGEEDSDQLSSSGSQARHSSPITDHLTGLPHREPFVFVRELVNCEPGSSAECATRFNAADPIFAGHFPGNPLVPGVILTEALAQTAGIAAASGYPQGASPLFLLSAIRSMKFFEAVKPETRVLFRAEKLIDMDGLLQFKVEATVNGSTVAEGQLVLSVARDPDESAPAAQR